MSPGCDVPWALRTKVDCPFPVIDLSQVPTLRGPEWFVHLVAAWWWGWHLHSGFGDRVVRTDDTCIHAICGCVCKPEDHCAIEYSIILASRQFSIAQ